MPTASPPLEFGGRRIGRVRFELSPRRMLVAANALSLSRGFAALGILAMTLAGVSVVAVLLVAAAMWLTDVLDGWVARRAWDRGARKRTDGEVLDPLMDDVAFVCGFLILFGAGVVPLWFVAGLLVSRVVFALIRMAGLADSETFYAGPLPITKFNGVVLALGQLLLLAHLGFSNPVFAGDALAAATIAVMTASTVCSVVQFAVRRHGRLLARLLTP